MLVLIMVTTLINCFLVVYHHILWPLIMYVMAYNKTLPSIKHISTYIPKLNSLSLPNIEMILPVYNEEKYIAEKLWNLLIMDYPNHKLHITIICDGCTDNTAKIANEVTNSAQFKNFNVSIIEHEVNRGKLTVINEAVSNSNADIIALSDCSALLSSDSLQRAAKHFDTRSTGVVCGTYKVLNHLHEGESKYWKYQRKIKELEAKNGNVLGAHGAFYLFRQKLFTPLESDIINDDFIIPMQIIMQKYKSVYDPDIIAWEMEESPLDVDWNRRKRIAAGNLQQVIKLRKLLSIKHGYTALSFFSGKVLRIFMPVIMIIALLGSIISSYYYPLFYLILAPQLIAYSIAFIVEFTPIHNKIFDSLNYIVRGHLVNLIGIINYVFKRDINWNNKEAV